MTDSLPDLFPILLDRALNILVVGRAGVDLLSNDYEPSLIDAKSFSKYIGGSPANIAIGLARLGVKTSILTRVGADQFGDFIKRDLDFEGIDTSNIVFDQDHLTPIAISVTDDADTPDTIFLRAECADLYFNKHDIRPINPKNYRAAIFVGSSLVNQIQREAVFKLIHNLETNSVPIIFDIDYRPAFWGAVKLWEGSNREKPSQLAREKILEILPHSKLVVGSESEFRLLSKGIHVGDGIKQLQTVTDAIFVIHSANGCTIYNNNRVEFIHGYHVDVVSPLGAGDAFLAGLVKGILDGRSLAESAKIANANGAIVTASPKCSAALATMTQIDSFLTAASKTLEDHCQK